MTLTAATLDTVHEGKFNDEYAWREVRRIHADILVPTGIVQAEDIRWQWVTYEKVAQFYQDHQVGSSHLLLYFLYSLLVYLHVNCSYIMTSPSPRASSSNTASPSMNRRCSRTARSAT